MSSDQAPLVQRVESSFRQLSAVASDLNLVSDELGKSIAELDSALRKLNLGLTVWVVISSDDDLPEGQTYRSEDLGYAKVNGQWGVALRTVLGHYSFPDEETVQPWLFNDAPRSLRLSAIGKIPELLEKLSAEATEATTKIRSKLAEAQEVAAVVKKAALEPEKTATPHRILRVYGKSVPPLNTTGEKEGK